MWEERKTDSPAFRSPQQKYIGKVLNMFLKVFRIKFRHLNKNFRFRHLAMNICRISEVSFFFQNYTPENCTFSYAVERDSCSKLHSQSTFRGEGYSATLVDVYNIYRVYIYIYIYVCSKNINRAINYINLRIGHWNRFDTSIPARNKSPQLWMYKRRETVRES